MLLTRLGKSTPQLCILRVQEKYTKNLGSSVGGTRVFVDKCRLDSNGFRPGDAVMSFALIDGPCEAACLCAAMFGVPSKRTAGVEQAEGGSAEPVGVFGFGQQFRRPLVKDGLEEGSALCMRAAGRSH